MGKCEQTPRGVPITDGEPRPRREYGSRPIPPHVIDRISGTIWTRNGALEKGTLQNPRDQGEERMVLGGGWEEFGGAARSGGRVEISSRCVAARLLVHSGVRLQYGSTPTSSFTAVIGYPSL
jgi:hypothetical protein